MATHSPELSLADGIEKPSVRLDDVVNHAHRPHDLAWIGNDIDFSAIGEKKVLRKMDLHLMPMLTVLYLLSFLDRANIGNAKIEGLTMDLGLDGNKYNLCLTVFFPTYCLFEVPSNLLLKRLRPSIWLPSIMVAWGTVMTLMGIVQSYHGLLICRLFLGMAEAGLYPGVAYYLTMWYCTHEIQWRQGLFFSAASMAGAFSGLLAYAIVKMDNVGGLAGWRWIFILEGILTVIVATFAFFLLYDFPDTAPFLTVEERAWAVHRLKYQGSKASSRHVSESEQFQWKYVRQAFTDWQLYVSLLMYWGIVCPLYGIALFLPTIINELGYTASTAQLLTVPIYITASGLSITTCYYSDRAAARGRSRSPYVFWPMLAVLAGFAIAISASAAGHAPGVVYAGVFLATCFIYPAFPGNVAWISNNLAGACKRSVGMAFQIGIGSLGGAMASNFYRTQDQPQYLLGHGLEIAFVALGLVAVVILRTSYARINTRRDSLSADVDAGRVRRLTDAELSDMGDRAPTFRYML